MHPRAHHQRTLCVSSIHTVHTFNLYNSLAFVPALPFSRLPHHVPLTTSTFSCLYPSMAWWACAGSSARTTAMVNSLRSLSDMAPALWQSTCRNLRFRLPLSRYAGRRGVPFIFHSFDIWRFVYVMQCCKCRLLSAIHHTYQAWPRRPVSTTPFPSGCITVTWHL